MGTTESLPEVEEDRSPDPPRQDSLPPPRLRPLRRRRPPSPTAASVPARPLCRLRGAVLGLPGTGKHTLLDRLQGKDPFADADSHGAQPDGEQDDAVDPISRRDRATGNDGGESSSLSTTIVAPYQPPAEAWDRIELQVSLGLEPSQPPIDFGVLLVHPQHKRKKVQKHLKESLHKLLKCQGYERLDDNDSGDDHTTRPETTAEHPPRPVCLCILINFRDMLGENDDNNDHDPSDMDVTAVTMEALQEYPALEPDRIVLTYGHVSLFNCFGLHRLHSFTYQAYLQHKRWACEELLQKVQIAKRLAPCTSEALSYAEYLNVIGTASHRSVPVDGIHQARRENRSGDTAMNKNAPEKIQTLPRLGQPLGPTRRQIIPESTGPPSNAVQQSQLVKDTSAESDSRAALEAFLAGSDSDGEEGLAAGHEKRMLQEDSEDDDEGFIAYSSSQEGNSQTERTLRKKVPGQDVKEYEPTRSVDKSAAAIKPRSSRLHHVEKLPTTTKVWSKESFDRDVANNPDEASNSDLDRRLVEGDEVRKGCVVAEKDRKGGDHPGNNSIVTPVLDSEIKSRQAQALEGEHTTHERYVELTTYDVSDTKSKDVEANQPKQIFATNTDSLDGNEPAHVDQLSTALRSRRELAGPNGLPMQASSLGDESESSGSEYLISGTIERQDFESDGEDEGFIIDSISQASTVRENGGGMRRFAIQPQHGDEALDNPKPSGLSHEAKTALIAAQEEALAMLKPQVDRARKTKSKGKKSGRST